ncbi:hypothetical protein KKE60_05915 [Patescibacteria group bacterium]|nr:hypothetical protein [Patescibacteria group bacterium]
MRVRKPKKLTMEQWIAKLEKGKEEKIAKSVKKFEKNLRAHYNARIKFLRKFGLSYGKTTLNEKARRLYDYRLIWYTELGFDQKEAERRAEIYAKNWLGAMSF